MTIKKILMASAALTIFSAAIFLGQMTSCSKATSQTNGATYTLPAATSTTLGGVIIGNGLSVTSNGTLSVTSNGGLTQLNKLIFKKVINNGGSVEIWTANYDGTNAAKVNITLPSGVTFDDGMKPAMSPNGQKIFFAAGTSVTNGDLYSCNSDGTNVTKIVDKGGANNGLQLGDAY